MALRPSIQMVPEAQDSLDITSGCEAEGSATRTFRVISVGDAFLYLRPVSSASSGVGAISREDVRRIVCVGQ